MRLRETTPTQKQQQQHKLSQSVLPRGHHILKESVYQSACFHYVYYPIASFIIIKAFTSARRSHNGRRGSTVHMAAVESSKSADI